eukprot:784418-Rhodomonas_salina.2
MSKGAEGDKRGETKGRDWGRDWGGSGVTGRSGVLFSVWMTERARQLHGDWVELESADGELYFANIKTKETSWDPPPQAFSPEKSGKENAEPDREEAFKTVARRLDASANDHEGARQSFCLSTRGYNLGENTMEETFADGIGSCLRIHYVVLGADIASCGPRLLDSREGKQRWLRATRSLCDARYSHRVYAMSCTEIGYAATSLRPSGARKHVYSTCSGMWYAKSVTDLYRIMLPASLTPSYQVAGVGVLLEQQEQGDNILIEKVFKGGPADLSKVLVFKLAANEAAMRSPVLTYRIVTLLTEPLCPCYAMSATDLHGTVLPESARWR